MKIGPLLTKFSHLALGGPVIMTHRVVCGLVLNRNAKEKL